MVYELLSIWNSYYFYFGDIIILVPQITAILRLIFLIFVSIVSEGRKQY